MTKEKKGQSKADKHTHCTGKQTYTLTHKKKKKKKQRNFIPDVMEGSKYTRDTNNAL